MRAATAAIEPWPTCASNASTSSSAASSADELASSSFVPTESRAAAACDVKGSAYAGPDLHHRCGLSVRATPPTV
jgi:hypothetical protein